MKTKTPTIRKLFNIAWQRYVMNLVWLLLVAIFTTGSLLVFGGCATNANGVNTPQSDTAFQNDSTSDVRMSRVETHADRLLKEMGDYLKSADTFTFHRLSRHIESFDRCDR